MNFTPGADLAVVATTALAFVLGWALGYERYYHGRAAGTQVYCIVAMASCAPQALGSEIEVKVLRFRPPI